MSDRKYTIGPNAQTAEESRPLLPYSKVVIYAGTDADGNEVKYEAGETTGRTLEVENPWGTQTMANNMLNAIKGYVYQPFSATSVLVPDDAELGDGISVGDTYSVLAEQNLVFDALASSDIGAPGEDETDNEFGNYISSSQRTTDRKISQMETQFVVERGRILARIETAETSLGSFGTIVSGLSSTIEQLPGSIMAKVSADYIKTEDADERYATITDVDEQISIAIDPERGGVISSYVSGNFINNTTDKEDILNTAEGYTNTKATEITGSYTSLIEQTAKDIKSEVAKSIQQWEIPANVTIDVYGFDAPSIPASDWRNKYYLDQKNGYYWKSDGSRWIKQHIERLPLVTEDLYSQISQSADEISMEVTSNEETGQTRFVLRAGKATFDTGNLFLNVNAAYIKGYLEADSIAANSTITSPYIRFIDDTMGFIGSIQARGDTILLDAVGGITTVGGLLAIGGLAANGIVDFSSAIKVIMPDGTEFP